MRTTLSAYLALVLRLVWIFCPFKQNKSDKWKNALIKYVQWQSINNGDLATDDTFAVVVVKINVIIWSIVIYFLGADSSDDNLCHGNDCANDGEYQKCSHLRTTNTSHISLTSALSKLLLYYVITFSIHGMFW